MRVADCNIVNGVPILSCFHAIFVHVTDIHNENGVLVLSCLFMQCWCKRQTVTLQKFNGSLVRCSFHCLFAMIKPHWLTGRKKLNKKQTNKNNNKKQNKKLNKKQVTFVKSTKLFSSIVCTHDRLSHYKIHDVLVPSCFQCLPVYVTKRHIINNILVLSSPTFVNVPQATLLASCAQ